MPKTAWRRQQTPGPTLATLPGLGRGRASSPLPYQYLLGLLGSGPATREDVPLWGRSSWNSEVMARRDFVHQGSKPHAVAPGGEKEPQEPPATSGLGDGLCAPAAQRGARGSSRAWHAADCQDPATPAPPSMITCLQVRLHTAGPTARQAGLPRKLPWFSAGHDPASTGNYLEIVCDAGEVPRAKVPLTPGRAPGSDQQTPKPSLAP